jgi:hypothetical protein
MVVHRRPYFGLRVQGSPEERRAIYAQDQAEQRQLAVQYGLSKDGNWRTGPNPLYYPGSVVTVDWTGKDLNNWYGGILNDFQMRLVGDGQGNQYRVPMSHTPNMGLNPLERVSRMAKADDVLNTGDDAGAWSYIFGALCHPQTLQQQNVIFAMPKEGYPHGGYRAKTVAAITSGVGIAEAAAAGDSAHPTYNEISVGLKEHEHNVSLSTRLQVMVGADDVITWNNELQTGLTEFWTSLDTDLLQDTNTTANTNIESLDRVCATDAYETGHSYGAGDADIYSLDRSTLSWTEAYVNHNSDSNRALDISHVNDVLENSMSYWDTAHMSKAWANKFWFTGPHSWMDWSQIEDSKQRFTQETTVQTLPGGLQEIPGQAGGFGLTSFMTIPIVVDDNVINDTSGDRIMLIDGDATKISVGRPLEVVTSDNPLVTGHYTKANIYYIAELSCKRFKGNGMVVDLS